MGIYPAEKFFRQKITSEEAGESAKDISRIVTSILGKAETLQSHAPIRETSWEQLSVAPAIQSVVPDRNEDLQELLGSLALYKTHDKIDLDLLHARCAPNAQAPSNYEVDGLISCCVQDQDPSPSGQIRTNIRSFEKFKEHLSHLDYFNCYSQSVTDDQIRFAIYCGTLSKLRYLNKPLKGISFKSIALGGNFIRSLKENQAGPGMNFSSVTLETVTDLLSGSPKCQNSEFMQSDGKAQRMLGEFRAFRTHITKSGVALRLMSWKDPYNNITLANIGPKHELIIHDP